MNRIDLCVNGEFDTLLRAKTLSLTRVGAPFVDTVVDGIIYRLRAVPPTPVKYPYLIVSENIEESADILPIRDFRRINKQMKKKIRKGTGLEVTVSPVRKMDASYVGKWFINLARLYAFCHSSRCQFILSSGAGSEYEMVSGPCLDAILESAGIDPESHWQNMGEWLDDRLSRKVSYA